MSTFRQNLFSKAEGPKKTILFILVNRKSIPENELQELRNHLIVSFPGSVFQQCEANNMATTVSKAQQSGQPFFVLLFNQFTNDSTIQYCIVNLQKLKAKFVVYPRPTEIFNGSMVARTRQEVQKAVLAATELFQDRNIKDSNENDGNNTPRSAQQAKKLGIVFIASQTKQWNDDLEQVRRWCTTAQYPVTFYRIPSLEQFVSSRAHNKWLIVSNPELSKSQSDSLRIISNSEKVSIILFDKTANKDQTSEIFKDIATSPQELKQIFAKHFDGRSQSKKTSTRIRSIEERPSYHLAKANLVFEDLKKRKTSMKDSKIMQRAPEEVDVFVMFSTNNQFRTFCEQIPVQTVSVDKIDQEYHRKTVILACYQDRKDILKNLKIDHKNLSIIFISGEQESPKYVNHPLVEMTTNTTQDVLSYFSNKKVRYLPSHIEYLGLKSVKSMRQVARQKNKKLTNENINRVMMEQKQPELNLRIQSHQASLIRKPSMIRVNRSRNSLLDSALQPRGQQWQCVDMPTQQAETPIHNYSQLTNFNGNLLHESLRNIDSMSNLNNSSKKINSLLKTNQTEERRPSLQGKMVQILHDIQVNQNQCFNIQNNYSTIESNTPTVSQCNSSQSSKTAPADLKRPSFDPQRFQSVMPRIIEMPTSNILDTSQTESTKTVKAVPYKPPTVVDFDLQLQKMSESAAQDSYRKPDSGEIREHASNYLSFINQKALQQYYICHENSSKKQRIESVRMLEPAITISTPQQLSIKSRHNLPIPSKGIIKPRRDLEVPSKRQIKLQESSRQLNDIANKETPSKKQKVQQPVLRIQQPILKNPQPTAKPQPLPILDLRFPTVHDLNNTPKNVLPSSPRQTNQPKYSMAPKKSIKNMRSSMQYSQSEMQPHKEYEWEPSRQFQSAISQIKPQIRQTVQDSLPTNSASPSNVSIPTQSIMAPTATLYRPLHQSLSPQRSLSNPPRIVREVRNVPLVRSIRIPGVTKAPIARPMPQVTNVLLPPQYVVLQPIAAKPVRPATVLVDHSYQPNLQSNHSTISDVIVNQSILSVPQQKQAQSLKSYGIALAPVDSKPISIISNVLHDSEDELPSKFHKRSQSEADVKHSRFKPLGSQSKMLCFFGPQKTNLNRFYNSLSRHFPNKFSWYRYSSLPDLMEKVKDGDPKDLHLVLLDGQFSKDPLTLSALKSLCPQESVLVFQGSHPVTGFQHVSNDRQLFQLAVKAYNSWS